MERKNPQDVTYYQYNKQGNTVSELTKRFLKPETTKVQQADGRTLVSNSLAKTELEQYKTYEYNAFNQASKVVVEKPQHPLLELLVSLANKHFPSIAPALAQLREFGPESSASENVHTNQDSPSAKTPECPSWQK